ITPPFLSFLALYPLPPPPSPRCPLALLPYPFKASPSSKSFFCPFREAYPPPSKLPLHSPDNF
ncbi:hypothetical protein FRB95_000965, partial [Tulasnella sp. JGI-2019a]